MPKHMYLLIALTFVTGIATGTFLFFETRNTESPGTTELQQSEELFTVVARAYGGCERIGCPSYRLVSDGTYSYLGSEAQGGTARVDDALSEAQLTRLTKAFERVNFQNVEESVFSGSCPITYDGLAYRFEVTVRGTPYSIDTCENDVGAIPFFRILSDYFDAFFVLHGSTE